MTAILWQASFFKFAIYLFLQTKLDFLMISISILFFNFFSLYFVKTSEETCLYNLCIPDGRVMRENRLSCVYLSNTNLDLQKIFFRGEWRDLHFRLCTFFRVLYNIADLRALRQLIYLPIKSSLLTE